MASGARFNGVDFDDIFEPGTVVASSSLIRRGGGPLQYAARGSVPKYQNVGLRVGGSDVSNLWLPKGSAPPKLPIDGAAYNVTASAPTGATGTTSANVSVTLNSNGTYEVLATRGSAIEPASEVLASGTWLPSGGSVADYEVHFAGANSGGVVSNGAPTFMSLSASRTYSITASVSSSSSATDTGAVPALSINLRRVGAGVSASEIALYVSATGYL